MKLTTKDITRLVSLHTGVSVDDILSVRRTRKIAHARMAVCYIARNQGMSFPQIGKRMNRDHTTIIYAYEQVPELAKRDPAFAAMIEAVSAGKGPEGKVVTYTPAYAPKHPIVIKPAKVVQDEGEDHAHLFHKQIAAGTDALLAALRAAA